VEGRQVLKILQVTSFFRPSWEAGGIAKICYDISKRLAQRGHEVTVYTTDGFKSRVNVQKNCRVFVEDMNVFYFSNMSLFLASRNLCTPYMAPLIARKHMEEFDIIHVHTFRTILAILIWHYANKYGIPYVLQAHGSVLPFFQRQRLKQVFDSLFGYRILKDASKVIAVSQMEADQYASMGLSEEKIEITPHGINLSQFNELPKRGAFRRKYAIDSQEKIILYVGRIHRIKGVDILIKAYANLLREFRHAKLVIVGPDDGYLSSCKELAIRLGVEKKILFTGPLYGGEKLQVYVDADVFVSPSRYEVFGMTVLEACACAKSVVATNVAAAAQGIIINGRTGFLVQPENVLELAEALGYLLTNEAESLKMGMQAREDVMNMFSVQGVVDKMENLYEKILR